MPSCMVYAQKQVAAVMNIIIGSNSNFQATLSFKHY